MCPDSLLFYCFQFKLTFESIKELGGAFPLRVDPWGVKFILVKPKIYYCNFKTFCLCVRKVDWVLKPYIYIRGWWFFILLDDSKMYRLDQVFLFSKFSFAFVIYHKFWHCNYLCLFLLLSFCLVFGS